jgi:AcrR family transcriptional regulator
LTNGIFFKGYLIMRPDRPPSKDKKDQIIEAAARVFAKKGYAGAAVADIAVEAEIGKGTIYAYFDSKEDLFFAVFEWFMQQTGAAAKVSISHLGGSASQRLEALSDSIMGMWDEIKDAFILTIEFWAASSSSQMRVRFKDAFRRLYEEFRAIVVSLIRDGIERGEFRSDVNVESVAAALVGTWDALFLQAWFGENFDPLTTARNFLKVVIRGLSHKD